MTANKNSVMVVTFPPVPSSYHSLYAVFRHGEKQSSILSVAVKDALRIRTADIITPYFCGSSGFVFFESYLSLFYVRLTATKWTRLQLSHCRHRPSSTTIQSRCAMLLKVYAGNSVSRMSVTLPSRQCIMIVFCSHAQYPSHKARLIFSPFSKYHHASFQLRFFVSFGAMRFTVLPHVIHCTTFSAMTATITKNCMTFAVIA